MTWQLLRDGKVIAEHPTKVAIYTEAIERHLVIDWSADFPGDKTARTLVKGVEIKRK